MCTIGASPKTICSARVRRKLLALRPTATARALLVRADFASFDVFDLRRPGVEACFEFGMIVPQRTIASLGSR